MPRCASASGTDDAAAMVKLLAERACAKINLFLRVTGRRADGYHELDSIFVPISIADRITLELRPAQTSSITLRCNIASLGAVESNLASRAARAFMDEFGICGNVIINLEKAIPAGAGLGGGSSDAGTVLRMLSAMTSSILGESEEVSERLHKIAVGLGADVPFFLNPQPARVTGIGERIGAFEKFPRLHLVIAVPPLEVSTASVFKALKREDWSGAASVADIDEIVRDEIPASHLRNDLEAPAMHLYPQITKLKALLQECGASATSMSGSGGSVFGTFRDEGTATRSAKSLRLKAPEARVFVAQSLDTQSRPQD
jgi:4-diphosphocytidyl-2-C-methyl-D-erythritol kinase